MAHILMTSRVEDWPVMPVEIYQVHFKPSDFFERNPAIDVPSTKNNASVLDEKGCCSGEQKLEVLWKRVVISSRISNEFPRMLLGLSHCKSDVEVLYT